MPDLVDFVPAKYVVGLAAQTIVHGSNRDVDTSAEVLTSTSSFTPRGVLIKADAANTGIVYVGNSNVTAGTAGATDGYPLSAGDFIALSIQDPSLVYVIASANNQIVYFLGA